MQLCFFQYLLFAKGEKSDNFASVAWHSACNCSQQQVRILYEFKYPFSWWVFGFLTVLQEPLKSWPLCGLDCITELSGLRKTFKDVFLLLLLQQLHSWKTFKCCEMKYTWFGVHLFVVKYSRYSIVHSLLISLSPTLPTMVNCDSYTSEVKSHLLFRSVWKNSFLS